jgi:hypothetical protein
MAIIYPKAPEGGIEIVYNKAKQLHQAHHIFGEARMEDLAMAQPHRWYAVPLADLAAGRFLSTATSGSWRHIFIQGMQAVGVGALSDPRPETGNELMCTGMYETCFGAETLEALKVGQQLQQIQDQDYEVRFLDCFSIYFFSVWLHGGADDIIIPLPPTYGRMDAYHPYSERNIVRLLQKTAECTLNSAAAILAKR